MSEHLELVSELAQLHFAEWGALEPDETVEVRTRELGSFGGPGAFPTAYVALDGTELVGSVLLVAADLALRPALTPWLAGVYVKPAYRQRGVATALIRTALEEAARQDLGPLYLYTSTSESLYSKLGWQVFERCSFRGTPIVIMRRDVAAAR